VVSGSLGCGAARLREATARALAAADAHVLEGCYDCLLEARSAYARLAQSKDRKTAAPSLARLFETDVLLALREKELALDSRGTIERARAVGTRLPPTVNPNRVLSMVDAVLPDPYGVPPEALDAMRAKHRAYVRNLQNELDWLAKVPLNQRCVITSRWQSTARTGIASRAARQERSAGRASYPKSRPEHHR